MGEGAHGHHGLRLRSVNLFLMRPYFEFNHAGDFWTNIRPRVSVVESAPPLWVGAILTWSPKCGRDLGCGLRKLEKVALRMSPPKLITNISRTVEAQFGNFCGKNGRLLGIDVTKLTKV